MTHFKLLIPGYNCEKYVEQCLNSVKMQTYKNWQAIVIDDASTDGTAKKISKLVENDDRFVFIRNSKNVRSVANFVAGIKFANCKDEDVIITIDLDDWLSRPDALSIVAEAYEDPDVWLTYGTYQLVGNGKIDNVSRPTLKEHDLRHGSMIWRHLRTFKYFLWKNVKDVDLRFSQTGEYYPSSYDVVMMRPMVEMCSYRHMKYIDEVLYIYNRANPLCDGTIHKHEQAVCGAEIYWKRPYLHMSKSELINLRVDPRDNMKNKPKILLIVDVLHWTLHYIAKQLKMRLSGKYDFTIIATNDLNNVDANKFDVVYLLGAYTGKPQTYKLPVKKTILGIRADYYLPDSAIDILEFCTKKLKSRGSYFTLSNQGQYKKLRNFVGNLHVLTDGVDLDCFNYKKFVAKRPNHKKLVVGYAGSTIALKGISMIEQACKSIDAIFKPALKKADNTHFTMKEMAVYYNSIDVYVCMSSSEGICLPILEAGAMNIPVISTRVGIANEIIKHGKNGFLIDRNPTDLAKHLKILEDKESRDEFGTKLRLEIEANWGWNIVIPYFDTLFQEVITGKTIVPPGVSIS